MGNPESWDSYLWKPGDPTTDMAMHFKEVC